MIWIWASKKPIFEFHEQLGLPPPPTMTPSPTKLLSVTIGHHLYTETKSLESLLPVSIFSQKFLVEISLWIKFFQPHWKKSNLYRQKFKSLHFSSSKASICTLFLIPSCISLHLAPRIQDSFKFGSFASDLGNF